MASSKITRSCRICGTKFTARKSTQTLCSHACRAKSKITRVTLQCRECKGDFTREPNQIRGGRKYFCSRECSFKHGKPFEKKFWAKVQKTETCWLWTGTVNNKGYGETRYEGRFALSHRVSFIIHKGPIPEGMVVRHRCDNPPCLNPKHLELGTIAENTKDKIMKQRQAQGTTQGHAKFTEQTLREAKRLRSDGWTYLELERHFNISRQTISKAVRGETWRHVS